MPDAAFRRQGRSLSRKSIGAAGTLPVTINTYDHAASTYRVRTTQMQHIAADGYGFDYVMVFKAQKEEVLTTFADKAVRQIMAAGLSVRVYFSSSGKEIFCEIRAPVERLKQFADQVKFRPRTIAFTVRFVRFS